MDGILTYPDEGKGKCHFVFGGKSMIPFQFPIAAENDVRNEIDQSLQAERRIPAYSNIMLDAFNAFDTRRFNESVILMNAAFEATVAEYLIETLINAGKSADESKKEVTRMFSKEKALDKERTGGLHKILQSDFKKVTGRSLKDDPDLWQKFEFARNKRANAVHPFLSQINETDAFFVISYIIEIVNWIHK